MSASDGLESWGVLACHVMAGSFVSVHASSTTIYKPYSQVGKHGEENTNSVKKDSKQENGRNSIENKQLWNKCWLEMPKQ